MLYVFGCHVFHNTGLCAFAYRNVDMDNDLTVCSAHGNGTDPEESEHVWTHRTENEKKKKL